MKLYHNGNRFSILIKIALIYISATTILSPSSVFGDVRTGFEPDNFVGPGYLVTVLIAIVVWILLMWAIKCLERFIATEGREFEPPDEDGADENTREKAQDNNQSENPNDSANNK